MTGFLATYVGLDLGTANTLLYVKGRGIAVKEPSLVTVRTSTGDIVAVGGEAEAGLGRTPRKFRTARPVRAGIINDLQLCEGMLRRFLGTARVTRPLHRLRVAMAVPSGTTEVERRAIIESVRAAGAADVILVEQLLAAAQGAGLAIEEARGRMVVNIGAGVTDIAVISLANSVLAQTSQVAGDDMDAAITAHVRATHQLVIGERTAEQLKIQIGSALPGDQALSMRIKGRCIVQGIPREVLIHDYEIREALSTPVHKIMHVIQQSLEQAPPELSADLIETGIVPTGGTALLRNLDKCISQYCELPVKVAQDPLACVILGLAHQLEHLRRSDWRRFGLGS